MASASDAGPDMTVMLVRVRFDAAAPEGAACLLTFTDPQPGVAVASLLPLEAMSRPAPERAAAELRVLCVPAGSADEAAWRDRAQAWMESATDDGDPPLRAGGDGSSVLWKAGRAVILAPADRMEPALAAVAEFAYYEWQLRRLETEIAADWHILESHMPLAQEVRAKDLKGRPGLAAGTAQTMQRRLRCARLERRLMSPAASLGEAAVKLGRRLRDEAEIGERLETLDGQIEIYEYVYELANQRMGEYRNFRREYIVEILIVLLLAAEVVLMAWQFTGY
jgi:hypothetical protein